MSFNNGLIDTSKYEDGCVKHPNKHMPKHCFRWCYVGSSGAGKTNVLLNTLDHLYFDKLHIICPTALTQPKYLYVKDKYDKEDEKIRTELRRYNKKNKTMYDIEDRVSLHEEMPENFLDSLNKQQVNLVVFDDMVCTDRKQEKAIVDCFIRGRHLNASFIYLTQSFYKIPRVIRLNCSCFNIFHSTNKSELAQLHKDIGLQTDKKSFVDTISKLVEPLYSFVHINIDSIEPFRQQDMTTLIKFNKE